MIRSRKQQDIRNLLDLDAPLPQVVGEGPPPPEVVRPKYHGDECACESCCDIRASMDLYLQARKLYNQNGF